jgi:CRP/FNR family transcriptional regulator
MTATELGALYPVLAKLPGGLLQRIVDAMQTMSVPAGTVVFDEHQPCRGFPFVLAGAVRVTAKGEEPFGVGCTLARRLTRSHLDRNPGPLAADSSPRPCTAP